MDILIEKINVSDDKFLLSELFVSNGDKVIKGTKIYTIESSKAAIDVEAPCDGYIYFNEGVEEMEQYPAGFCIAKIVDTAINPLRGRRMRRCLMNKQRRQYVLRHKKQMKFQKEQLSHLQHCNS